MTTPYYEDDLVTLYHGDCREITEWLAADVLVMDPPYGRSAELGSRLKNGDGQGRRRDAVEMIAGDESTETRDQILEMWGDRPAIVFGDPLISQPTGARQALVYAKPFDAGIRGAHAGFRRDVEMVYLCGPWPSGIGGETSILRTGGYIAGPRGIATTAGHPHTKPQDVMETLVGLAVGRIADPTSGGGSTLVAAKALGRHAIGVEFEERYCEIAAKRLAQDTLFGSTS